VTAHRGHGLLLRPHDGTLDCDGQFGVDNCVTSADIVRTSSEIGCVFITKTNTTTQAYSRTQGLPKMTTVKRKKHKQADRQTNSKLEDPYYHGGAKCMNVSLLCQFATWTFRTFGRFDTRTFGYLPGRFATCLKVCSLRYCKNFTILTFTFSCYIKTGLQSLSSGCETSREVANCPGIEMSKGSKRPGGEASM